MMIMVMMLIMVKKNKDDDDDDDDDHDDDDEHHHEHNHYLDDDHDDQEDDDPGDNDDVHDDYFHTRTRVNFKVLIMVLVGSSGAGTRAYVSDKPRLLSLISLHKGITTLLFMNPQCVLPFVNSKLIVCLLLYSEAQVG